MVIFKGGEMLQKPDLNKPCFFIFPKMKEKIEKCLCSNCGNHLEGKENEFRDEISRSEYTVSGMCQKCQDTVFESAEE